MFRVAEREASAAYLDTTGARQQNIAASGRRIEEMA